MEIFPQGEQGARAGLLLRIQVGSIPYWGSQIIMIYKNEKEKQVIAKMIELKIIPSQGPISVTQELLDQYIKIYDSLFSKDVGVKTTSNSRFARKLAALTFVRLNEHRRNNSDATKIVIERQCKTKEGFLYIISNPSFPDCFKIGITKDLKQRLNTYQTYDPFRKFKLEKYFFCEDAKNTEKELLEKYSIDVFQGEWISNDKYDEIYKDLFK